ncbi:CLUMA_CG007174, isoform A [Clunio marinus]|uniref:Protein O-mannosyltransferase 1 n=1 Tax=Clunio marinus TaxID=568069 RepID=A0A1J1I054_9DIPT|nr:CLUMA_CG007174, isoform A [Clunio marinus]
MGTEIKSQENCENSLRNRKKKEALTQNNVLKSSEKSEVKPQNESKGKVENQQQIESTTKPQIHEERNDKSFRIRLEFDPMSVVLFTLAIITRFFKLSEPRNVVFDELHYGKYVSLYMRNVFFFEKHPPLGKQLIASAAYFAGYNGNNTFSKIGSEYSENVPIFWLRFIPALFGSLLVPVSYNLLLQLKINRWVATLGGLLIVFDNALLTQSRFILMEPMLILFSTSALLFLMRFLDSKYFSINWCLNGLLAGVFYSFSISVKYVGFYSYVLGGILVARHIWLELRDKTFSDLTIAMRIITKGILLVVIPTAIYLGIFHIHLNMLYKAGPHDSVMTSAFQASLEGGLASITHGQPLKVVHGSQITLRHTNGRPCWLHSHAQVYPVKYEDKRGSSHQQQVTCYSFKDVNNWWIVKRPSKVDFSIGDELDMIKDGDEIQLVHGLTSRALNSHDVAAPVSPQSQEVSCYIDYNISMPGQLLWRVEILNKEEEGIHWHAIKSQVRLVHVTTQTALRFTGRQLPQWGYNQHEIAADKNLNHPDTSDQKERERQLLKSEMIPMERTDLSFWQKFRELQSKMFWQSDTVQNHMYSSEPLEWPFLSKGIAYWYQKDTNAQIHLLGNIALWYSTTFSLLFYVAFLVFYLLRRRRQFIDLNDQEWRKFQDAGFTFLLGYLINFLPYFFVERTLFLHNYLPALIYKIYLLCFLIEHIHDILRRSNQNLIIFTYKVLVCSWLIYVFHVFRTFLIVSYGRTRLTTDDVMNLRWRDTWDFIFS